MMKLQALETLLRRAANLIGIDITRFHPERTEAGRLAAMLEWNHINLIVDVGANQGQFARGLRQAGYCGEIVSFEPLVSAHEQLVRASLQDPAWHVADRTAVGSYHGFVEMQVAGNSVSSSVLEMLPSHSDAAPGSAVVATERVPIDTLDRLLDPYLRKDSRIFVKIDTQGYEDRVLDGAPTTLSIATGIQLELSLVALYGGQCLHDELMDRIRTMDFSIWAIWPGFFDPVSGRLLQFDATFFRDVDHR